MFHKALRIKILFILFLCPIPAHALNLISSMTFSEDGGYKMAQEDQVPIFVSTQPGGTGFNYCSTCTISRAWDGTNIKLFGAKGELLTWVTYLNASTTTATNVMVTISSFSGTGIGAGTGFSAVTVSSSNVWDFTQRPYSLYKYGYEQIVGMSHVDIAWDPTEYDLQQEPPRWRVPCTLQATNDCTTNGGGFSVRADANKHYPDAAVPIEEFAASSFTVTAKQSQAIGGEVYISTALVANSTYTATLTVYEGAVVSTTIPISLYVYKVTLPPTATLPVLAYFDKEDLALRLTGNEFPASYTVDPYFTNQLRVAAFLHRKKVTPVLDDFVSGTDYPGAVSSKFYDGTAYTGTYGLAWNTGPGYAVGDSTHVIGPYGGWNTVNWSTAPTPSANDFCTNASSYTAWCVNHGVKCYLYTTDDETTASILHTKDNAIAQLLSTSTPCAYNGQRLMFAQTGDLNVIAATAPYINTVWSTAWEGSSSATWVANEALYNGSSTHSAAGYNSAVGVDSILNTQEDGLGSREPLWGAWKTKQPTWFLWQINYWIDSNNGGQTQNGWNANTSNQNDMYNISKNFGYDNFPSTDAVRGHTGFNFTNGDGNLLYYSTDTVYNNPAYGFNGIIGSWKLNMLSRGIQDVDIINSAYSVNPALTTTYVNAIVQDVMYLRQCFNLSDCSYSYGIRPWDQVENDYEKTRESLLQIASGVAPTSNPVFSGNAKFSGKAKIY